MPRYRSLLAKTNQNLANHRVEDHRLSCTPDTDTFLYTQKRTYGVYHAGAENIASQYLSHQLPGLLKPKEFKLGRINKIFASQWVTDRQVVFGTKCNKLIVMDMLTKQMARIPSLGSSDLSSPADLPCGIHSIAMNPSHTLLATGAENVNDMAIYRLPTFDPVAVCERGHTDWIFDIKWLDDQFLVTGSRDTKLALWRVEDPGCSPNIASSGPSPSASLSPTSTHPSSSNSSSSTGVQPQLRIPQYSICKPLEVKECKKADKVRAMAYSDERMELAALSLNAYIHIWDAATFQQKVSRKLTHTRENVCMAINKDKNMYAVGSQSVVTLVDPRDIKSHMYVASRQGPCGIRSVNFKENVLTIGTGNGYVYFYDLRAGRYMELGCGHQCSLTMGEGWLRHDETYQDFFTDQEYPNAVYTHTFDKSGTKLFAAGGPLPAGLWGNYAALWQ